MEKFITEEISDNKEYIYEFIKSSNMLKNITEEYYSMLNEFIILEMTEMIEYLYKYNKFDNLKHYMKSLKCKGNFKYIDNLFNSYNELALLVDDELFRKLITWNHTNIQNILDELNKSPEFCYTYDNEQDENNSLLIVQKYNKTLNDFDYIKNIYQNI